MDPSFSPPSRLICLVLSMHNSWAGPAEWLRALSKLPLTALEGTALGIAVTRAHAGCAYEHAHMGAHMLMDTHLCLQMDRGTGTLINFKKPLTRHRTVKSNQGGSSDHHHINQAKGRHAKSMFFTQKQLYHLPYRKHERTASFVIKCLRSKGKNTSGKCTLQLFIVRCHSIYLFWCRKKVTDQTTCLSSLKYIILRKTFSHYNNIVAYQIK